MTILTNQKTFPSAHALFGIGLITLSLMAQVGCGRLFFKLVPVLEAENDSGAKIVDSADLDGGSIDASTIKSDAENEIIGDADVGVGTQSDEAGSPDSEQDASGQDASGQDAGGQDTGGQDASGQDSGATSVCHGVNDGGYVESSTVCGLGVCARTGILSCSNGIEVNSCAPGSATGSDSDCNGLDNDCDGTADEHYVSLPTNCGVGECARTGVLSCSNGVEVNSCAPGSPTGSDSDCNGLDNDCDGTADEHYVSLPTNCGVGECARTGVLSCSNGVEVNSCAPGSPTGSDSDCDGLDSDCDGTADEHYVVDASCGLGVCAPCSAASSCVDGYETPCFRGTPPNGSDNEAPPGDGQDNDCDGLVDEDVPCDTRDIIIASTASGQNISIPIHCTSMTVKLWGAGGGGGGSACGKNGGKGGSGGYTVITVNGLTGTEDIDFSIGGGGISGCGNLSGGTGTYEGGDGGDATMLSSENGQSGFGTRTGGVGGSSSSGGGRGGNGKDGGGGGGSGNPALLSFGVGNGGGGGGASVLTINAVEIATVGGGGGGGGAAGSLLCLGAVAGSDGGARCSANGVNGSSAGAGGGSGACFPAGNPWTAPPGSYSLGGNSCLNGNGGYTILNFAP